MIEVSIDGARGVLFNVAGGYDMSMSEIQEAAEIITGAVAPDANIIFGATLKPELEDELIITVVATGFDRDYNEPVINSLESAVSKTFNLEDDHAEAQEINHTISNAIDMELNNEEKTSAEDFASDIETKNIWAQDEEEKDESDIPAFLRRRKRNKKED
jgi:cell division protein ftsZ